MSVMTPLTLYLALANPVSDCGCFSDAWVLTNWQTFGKNIVLLIAAIAVFRERKLMFRFVTLKIEWMVSLYTLLFVFALSFYCLEYLPVLDFRPYKIGADIKAGMEIPEGAKPSVFESRFVLEKDGRQQEFTLDNYPDSTWTFVETRTVLKEKGYDGKELIFGIRPEDVNTEAAFLETFPESVVKATISVSELLGSESHLYCQVGDNEFIAKVDARDYLGTGETIELGFDLNKAHFFDKETEKTVY